MYNQGRTNSRSSFRHARFSEGIQPAYVDIGKAHYVRMCGNWHPRSRSRWSRYTMRLHDCLPFRQLLIGRNFFGPSYNPYYIFLPLENLPSHHGLCSPPCVEKARGSGHCDGIYQSRPALVFTTRARRVISHGLHWASKWCACPVLDMKPNLDCIEWNIPTHPQTRRRR